MQHRFLLATILIAASALPARAENWPQWRGPQGNGISSDPDPPTKWSEKENVAWAVALKGKGSSTPAVWGDRVFVTSQTDEDKKEWVLGLDRDTGKVLWEHFAGEGFTKSRAGANMASPSPSTDGDLVVASFGTGELVCLSRDGKELWKHNLQDQHGKFTVWWGYSISPVIHGEAVYVASVNEGPSYLWALDKKTGATKWKIDRKTEATSEACDGYATPIIYQAGGREEIMLTGALWATAYGTADGKELWRAKIGGDRTILSPIFHDGMIYNTAGKRGPVFAIQPGGSGDVTATHIKWNFPRSTPDVPCPVAVGDHIYLVNDTGIGMCVRKSDGKLMWQERIGGDMKCSPVAAAGKIYFTNEKGETTIVAAGEEFKPLAVNSIGEDAAMASLAFSDGQIFHRGAAKLYCIGNRRK